MKLIQVLFISLLGVILTACGGGDSGIPNQDGDGDNTELSIVSLQVTPPNATVPVGLTQQFVATATLSDGTTKDMTNDASLVWATDNATIATIASTNGVATGVTPGIITITAATGLANGALLSSSAQLEVIDATVVGLQVSPFNRNIPVGLSRAYKATAFLSDGSSRDVTNEPALTWSSNDTNIASIADTGSAIGVTPGKTTITASGNANGVSFKASTPLTVTNAVVNGLTISPYNRNVPVSMQRFFTATAQLSDGTSLDVTTDPALSWGTNNANVATIGIHSGVALGVSKGNVTITALGNANGKTFSATTPFTVTDAIVTNLFLTPKTSSILVGEMQQYTVTGLFSDGSTDTVTNAIWHSSNPSSVYVDVSGMATGVNPGSTYITASKDGITSDEAYLTIGYSNVVAWGDNNYGGDVDLVKSELHDVKAIYSSPFGATFAALRLDGSVVTWGPAFWGGDSSSVQSELNNVTSIVGTDAAFAALRADGTVITWGDKSRGGDSSSVATELHNVVSITPAKMGIAALRDDGSVVTWGASNGGGDSSPCASELHDIEYITSSIFDFTALRTDGVAISWGGHEYGSCRITPGPVLKVFGGRILTDIITSTNNGTFYLLSDNVLVGDDLVAPLNDVKAISTTGSNYAAIHNDGSVTTNLDNSAVLSELYDIESIQGNNTSFAAIRKDGHVITWGDSINGGDSSSVKSELHDVVSLSSTENSFSALRYDGTVVMWGSLKSEPSGVRPIENVRSLIGNSSAYAAKTMAPR